MTTAGGSGGVGMAGICKHFGDLAALTDVDLDAAAGEIHGIVGENGAGKTTLMRILAGLERADSGSVEVAEAPMPRTYSAAQALAAGVGLVPQHCEVAASLTVAESLALGNEPTRFGLFDRARVRRDGQRAADQMGFRFDWNAPAESLGMAQRQRLALVRLLLREARILILDEPTTVLTAQEVSALFATLRPLAAAGRTVLFITHKLAEVRSLADRITVLRSGRVVGRVRSGEVDDSQLARMMIGDLPAPPRRERPPSQSRILLRLTGINLPATEVGMHALRQVSLQVHGGEIVGVAGVEGNGQDELVDVVSGRRRPASGTVELAGTAVQLQPTRRRRALGLAIVPADRMHQGTNLSAAVWENATATRAASTAPTRLGVLPVRRLRRRGAEIARQVGVRTPATASTAGLSGGNIQRVVIGRELDSDPSVVVTAHPTRGVDVRGIEFIHQRMFDLRDAGRGVLVISSDLDELTAVSDRIHVLAGGRLLDDFAPGERDATEIGLLMAGRVPLPERTVPDVQLARVPLKPSGDDAPSESTPRADGRSG